MELDESEYEKRARAGLIPHMLIDGERKFLMMISSNVKFGGTRPMISKGKIEEGENELEAAIREAEEELGLRRSNMASSPVLLADERVTLRSGAYHLTVFGVPIKDRYAFDKWCDETEYVEWMSLNEFREAGRRDHVRYVELLADQLR